MKLITNSPRSLQPTTNHPAISIPYWEHVPALRKSDAGNVNLEVKPLEGTEQTIQHSATSNVSKAGSSEFSTYEDGLPSSFIYIKKKGSFRRIMLADIVFLKAQGSYCDVCTDNERFSISKPLAFVLGRLNYPSIVRCHRSYAVSIRHLQSFNSEEAVVISNRSSESIPIGRKFRVSLLEIMKRFVIS